jgi:hypothetical protein
MMLFDLVLSAPDVLAQTATPWVKNPNMVGALLGSGVGVFGGIYGPMAGILAPRGRCKTLVMTVHYMGIVIGLALIIVAIIAMINRQPYLIWYGLGLPGLIIASLMVGLLPVVKLRYRQAEARKLEAESFRRG